MVSAAVQVRGSEDPAVGDVVEAEPSAQKGGWCERGRESQSVGILQRSGSKTRYNVLTARSWLTQPASRGAAELTGSHLNLSGRQGKIDVQLKQPGRESDSLLPPEFYSHP